MTNSMESEELHEAFADQRFDVIRSQLYYSARAEILRKWALLLQAVELIAALGAFAAFWTSWPVIGKIIAALAALSAGLGLVVVMRDERACCLRSQAAFGEVFKLLPVVRAEETSERLRKLVEARADAEKGDRPNLECLNVRCYNEACDVVGRPDAKKPLTFCQSTIGLVIRIPYHDPAKNTNFKDKSAFN